MCSEKYHKAMKNKALWYFLEIYLLTAHFFYRNQFTVFGVFFYIIGKAVEGENVKKWLIGRNKLYFIHQLFIFGLIKGRVLNLAFSKEQNILSAFSYEIYFY